MNVKSISECTESEFLVFMEKICKADFPTEDEHTDAVILFEELSEHPSGSDLIYYPAAGADNSPAGIVETVKAWRAANGKPGFKAP